MGSSWGDDKRWVSPQIALTSRSAGGLDMLASTDVNGAGCLVLQLSGGTTPVVTVSASLDGVTFTAISAYDTSAAAQPNTMLATVGNGLFRYPMRGFMFVKVTLTSIAGGTESGFYTLTSEEATP